jgi:phosphopentomutase
LKCLKPQKRAENRGKVEYLVLGSKSIKKVEFSMDIKRAIIIVLDSVGIGELPDALSYGDVGSNTIGNIVKVSGGIKLPTLCKLGLGSIDGIDYLEAPDEIIGCYGKMAEVSKGKDTITGHWEIAGIQLPHEFPLFHEGFPNEILDEFRSRIKTDILGNYAASGTEIIKELGEEHIKTGYPIVYTSADSVFQIAAHEEIIPLDMLYKMCETAREILAGPYGVGRVIARPFIGEPGNFVRTSNRRDFSIAPSADTILDKLKEKGLDVIAIGKIEDIFSGKGITEANHTKNNMSGVDATLDYIKKETQGLIFTNLVDFDMLYGHRNNIDGYKMALEEFDNRLGEIMTAMREDDILLILADHGCDPSTPSTDHSREYVPLLIYGKGILKGVNLRTRSTFADVASTLGEIFDISYEFPGTSFYKDIKKD